MQHNINIETVQQLIPAFLSGKSPNTLTAYHLDLLDFHRWLRLRSLAHSVEHLLSLGHSRANALAMAYRADQIERNLAPATVNRRLATLRALVKLAVKHQLVDWALRPESVKHKTYSDTRGPAPAFVSAMLATLDQKSGPLVARNRAILRLLFDLGLRRGEVAALENFDVDLVGDTIAVTGKGTREKQRFSLPQPTKQALQQWLAARGGQPGPLFVSFTSGRGKRITGKAIYRMIKKLGHQVGGEVRPHGVRHSAITEALRQTNGNIQAVQRFSRHKDVRVVLTYDDNRQDLGGQVASAVSMCLQNNH